MTKIVASTTRTIKWIAKSATYTAQILSRQGDLWLRYTGTSTDGSSTNVTSVYPDYASMDTKPVLLLYIMSSRASEGLVQPTDVTFYFNDTKIDFGDTGVSTGTFADLFEKVLPSSNDDGCYGLRLLDSAALAKAAAYTSCTIKMVGTIQLTSGTSTFNEEIECSYTINISQETENGYFVTIGFADNDEMAITSKDDSLTLVAHVYQESTDLTEGSQSLYFIWDKMDTTSSTGWTTFSGNTNKLVVSADDVDTVGTFRVRAYLGSDATGKELGQDIQDVMDVSDPYEVDANPTPADETVSEVTGDDETGVGITYKPSLHVRGQTAAVSEATFDYATYDAAKNHLESGLGVTEFTISYGAVAQANGEVSLIISAKIAD